MVGSAGLASHLPLTVVNQHLAERFWPGGEALGEALQIEGLVLTLVGVAIGLGAALVTTRALEAVLYGIGASGFAAGGVKPSRDAHLPGGQPTQELLICPYGPHDPASTEHRQQG